MLGERRVVRATRGAPAVERRDDSHPFLAVRVASVVEFGQGDVADAWWPGDIERLGDRARRELVSGLLKAGRAGSETLERR